MHKTSFWLAACIFLLATSFFLCDAAPSGHHHQHQHQHQQQQQHRDKNEPFWYKPCGKDVDEIRIDPNDLTSEIESSMRNVRIQFQLTFDDFRKQDYDYHYDGVRIGVHDYQYIPNWLPGKKDVHSVKRLVKARLNLVSNHLPKMHSDLQKFAVAIEEMYQDEQRKRGLKDSLESTKSYLRMMLCEIETSIVSTPGMRVPERVERDIMSERERDPADDTHRLVRDWGVMLKYKDYLHAWKHVFQPEPEDKFEGKGKRRK